MTVNIFLLNAPPNSGKDFLANIAVRHDRSFLKSALAFPIKQANKAFFDLNDEQYNAFENNRELKESPQTVLLGKTWRQVNIEYGERFVKPLLGRSAFSELLIKRLRKNIRSPKQGFNLVISDCGFNDEIEPFVREFGHNNVHVIKILRKGYTFRGDSRSYVDSEDMVGVNTYYLRNSKSEHEFLTNGFRLMQSIKNGDKPNTKPFSDSELKSGQNNTTKSKGSKSKK